jgi:hypothetical protein
MEANKPSSAPSDPDTDPSDSDSSPSSDEQNAKRDRSKSSSTSVNSRRPRKTRYRIRPGTSELDRNKGPIAKAKKEASYQSVSSLLHI